MLTNCELLVDFENEMSESLNKSGYIEYAIPKQSFDNVSKKTILELTNILSKVEPFADGIKAIDK